MPLSAKMWRGLQADQAKQLDFHKGAGDTQPARLGEVTCIDNTRHLTLYLSECIYVEFLLLPPVTPFFYLFSDLIKAA